MGRCTKTGRECKLYYNANTYASPSWVEIARAKDVALSLGKNTTEVVSRATNWSKTLGTTRTMSLNFGYDYKQGANDAVWTALFTSYNANSGIELAVLDGAVTTVGTDGFRAYFEVTEMEWTQSQDDQVTYDITAQHTDECDASGLYRDPARMTITT